MGRLVREWRLEKGLTQCQLATAAEVSVGVVRDLEQGRTTRIRPRTAGAIADALDLNADRAREFMLSARGPTAVWQAHPARRGEVRLSVLGPLTARIDDVVAELGPPSRRALLALLALSPDELVHRSTLIDALWGISPPPTAVNKVQAHVGWLRRLLDPGRPRLDPHGLLVCAGTSYRLRTAALRLDLIAFRDLVRTARCAADTATACDLYERAFGLWNGDPVCDVDILRGHPAVVRLGQERAAAVIAFAQTACEMGWHDRTLPHLLELTQREPLNERAHALLLIALAGSGQQAAAIEAFDDLRRRLDSQLGVRPCAELSEAYQRVLVQEIPAPAVAADDPVPGRAAPAVPRMLPAAVPHFTGRASELQTLTGLVGTTAGSGGMVVISAIGGTAGIGKTALAVRWAHQAAERFPDGQLYVNLRGYDPSGAPMTAREAIRGFLDALAVPPERIPASTEAQVGLYRSLLAGTRTLIVLDNARDADQVRPLLPGSPGAMVLVTSRNQLSGLVTTDGAQTIILDALTEAEARELLARRLGSSRIAAEPTVVAELTRLCARLPLALSIAAGRAASQPNLALAALAGQLADARTRLDALDAGDAAANIRAVFSWSYQNLSDPAARMFRLLSLHPGPDISVHAAVSLAGLPLQQTRNVLRELTGAHLIGEHSPGRFGFHDLLRVYAAEWTDQADSEDDRHAAVHRMLDHYLHTAQAARLMLRPEVEPVGAPPPLPGVAPESHSGGKQALEWFQAEHKVLLAVIGQAATMGFLAHAWQLPWVTRTFFDLQGHWQDWLVTQQTALAAARQADDPAGQACAYHALGQAQSFIGSYQDAQANLSRALDLFRQTGDLYGQAGSITVLAMVSGSQAHHAEALRHSQQAYELYRRARHKACQAIALNNIGWYQSQLGDLRRAVSYCHRSLKLHEEVGNRDGAAAAWDSLGYARQQLGQHAQAMECYRHAIALFVELGDRRNEAISLSRLGDAHGLAGHLGAARESWQQALGILDALRFPEADEVRGKLLGLVRGTPGSIAVPTLL